ncbi:hypothetical protein GMORB2_3896 [Geosmithia morbida]|uniref:SPRY domain-containing protein n=1 Tax=Geosmithia morbida TaxID=1094350 RepID=A0A9P5D3K8_9HYPO|nr:uncharacterized protein GMORB2_3896 [Geosmithia morbida]KAF4125057.1 hypothetical protein GMORB2_3896 [Geosmithia morbida]
MPFWPRKKYKADEPSPSPDSGSRPYRAEKAPPYSYDPSPSSSSSWTSPPPPSSTTANLHQQQQQQQKQQSEPPPYTESSHDWQTAVPDTSLFPPPPAIFSGYDASPATNASEEEARLGEQWCEDHPLSEGSVLTVDTAGSSSIRTIRLMEPAGFKGQLTWLGGGTWRVRTARGSPDRCLISYPPLYHAHPSSHHHDPLAGERRRRSSSRTGDGEMRTRSIYYEVRVLPDSPEVTVALGLTALPYPSFRMPGWHRGSLAVHGDDGHRFVNDCWGGREFTGPFSRGETLGLGLTVRSDGGGGGESEKVKEKAASLTVDVFFTRNGHVVGGWNIHEETDAQSDRPVTGLEGLHDLCAAVGTYDGVGVDVVFDPAAWLYKGI